MWFLNLNKLQERFQNCVVLLVGAQLFQMCLCLLGREFPVTKMVRLLIPFQSLLTGLLKFYRLIKVKQKLPKMFCIALIMELKWVG